MLYHRVWNTVPCAVQWDLVLILHIRAWVCQPQTPIPPVLRCLPLGTRSLLSVSRDLFYSIGSF